MKLHSHNLIATFVACGLALLARGQASTPASSGTARPEEEIVTLNQFTVTATDDYYATNVLSGTRFNTSLHDLPVPIDVVTRDFMNDIGARDIAEALQYISGISMDREGDHAGKTDSDVVLRGFEGGGGGVSSGGGNQYINGYRTFGNFDNISIERIEVLKGPSSLFSGAIGAGGALNTITRQPTAKPSGLVSLYADSFDSVRVELESSGSVLPDKKLLYWVGMAVQDYGSWRDFANYKRVVISPTLQWNPTPKTRVMLFSQWMNNEQVPASNPVFFNPSNTAFEPNVRPSFNLMGPEAFNDSQQSHTIVDVVQKLNENWSIKVGGIYRTIDGERNLITTGANVAINTTTGARTASRTASAILTEERGHALQAYLLGKLEYAGLTHQLIAGYEYFTQIADEDVRRKTPALSRIDIDNPVSYALGDPWDLSQYPRLAGRYRRNGIVTNGYSLNNLWQTAQKRLTVQLGYRRDETEQYINDFVNPTASFEGDAKPADLISGGAAIRVLPQVVAFYSFRQSYEPLVKSDFFGNPFKPREGEGTDIGLRWDVDDGRFSTTVTYFEATNKNLEQSDPDHPGFQVQSGVNDSEGVEVSVFARPIKQWNIVASYTYNETVVVEDITRPFNVGLELSSVPRHRWSLWNRYRFDKSSLKGLSLGVGVIYVSERRGHPNLQDYPGLRVPEYYLTQFTASYATRIFGRQSTFAFGVKNVFDEFYRSSWRGIGDPRSYTGRVTFKF